jgi:hypothetical protein
MGVKGLGCDTADEMKLYCNRTIDMKETLNTLHQNIISLALKINVIGGRRGLKLIGKVMVFMKNYIAFVSLEKYHFKF